MNEFPRHLSNEAGPSIHHAAAPTPGPVLDTSPP